MAVGGQHHGDQVFLAGILLTVRQVHRHGGTTLGGLPGHGDGSAAAQSRGGDLHLILRRDHVVGIGGPIIGRIQGQAGHGVRSRQTAEAGSADQVERVGLILLIGAALQTGLTHYVRIFQAVGLDTIRQGSCLALPAAGLVAVGVARFVDTDVGGIYTVTRLKIGIERVVRMVRNQVGTLGGGNVLLGHLAVGFPVIVDTNAYGLDPLAGRQLGGEGGPLLHLQRATDMAELAVGQVEGVGGGDQVHGVGVLHRDNGAELTGEHRLAGGDGLAAHGGADGQRRGLALQELGVLVDGAEQRIVQGLGLGVRGGIEALHGGIIGLLSGLVILQAVGSGVVDRHVGRQLLEVCSMALVRVGGEPDGRQAIRRLIQLVSILVVMDAEVVGGAIDSGNVSVVDAAEGVAAFFQHILHRVAGVIGDILRLDVKPFCVTAISAICWVSAASAAEGSSDSSIRNVSRTDRRRFPRCVFSFIFHTPFCSFMIQIT